MDRKKTVRFEQRFQNYQAMLVELRTALAQTEYSNLERAGLIQLFEVSFELAWKSLKDLLEYEGFEMQSPRAVIKQAFAAGLLHDADIWLEALQGRNLFTHTYDSTLAANAVALIKNTYADLLFALEATLRRQKP